MEQILSEVLEGIDEWKREIDLIVRSYERKYDYLLPDIITECEFKINKDNEMEIECDFKLYYNDEEHMVEDTLIYEGDSELISAENAVKEVLDLLFSQVVRDEY